MFGFKSGKGRTKEYCSEFQYIICLGSRTVKVVVPSATPDFNTLYVWVQGP